MTHIGHGAGVVQTYLHRTSFDPTRTSADCDRSSGRGRIVLYGGHYEPVENGGRDVMSVVESVDDNNEIEPGHHEETLAATAETCDPCQIVTVQQRTAKPPMITI